MTPRAALELAAPQTWGAAILPAVWGALMACAAAGRIDLPTAAAVVLCAVLLQSAVNTLNDYADFVSGNDRVDNCPDPTDAALVYHDISLRAALVLGFVFLCAAGLTGLFLLIRCGWSLGWFGLAALTAILLYTLPVVSFSALPVGELLSGGMMGCVLALAAFYAQTGALTGAAAVRTLPMLISVAVIMMANNASDIEKDLAVGRHTLPALLGRRRTVGLLKLLLLLEVLLAGLSAVLWFPHGAWAVFPCGAALLVNGWKLAKAGFAPGARVRSMVLAMHNNIWSFLTCAAPAVLELIWKGLFRV